MCCGRSVVQKYGSSGGDSPKGWVVKYPDSRSEVKATEISARVAAALVPGATVTRQE
jgi:hypothetical protein